MQAFIALITCGCVTHLYVRSNFRQSWIWP